MAGLSPPEATRRIPALYYYRNLVLGAPLRYSVPAWCPVCETLIIPPAVNGGIDICPECRAMPED